MWKICKTKIWMGFMLSVLFLFSIPAYAAEMQPRTGDAMMQEEVQEEETSLEQQETLEETPEQAEPLELLEGEDSVPLVQNGDWVSQYFGQDISGLSEEGWETEFRSRVLNAIQNRATSIDVSDLNINKSEDMNQLRGVYRSCIKGDCFFLSGGFSYSYYSSGAIVSFELGYYSDYCDSEGQPDPAKIQAALEPFYQEAAQAIEYASAGESELDVALLLHDWIVRECDYAYDEYLSQTLPRSVYNAYGILVNRRAVCNGYAVAYSYLLECMGIPSYVLSSDSMNHAWNLVYLDGGWYHADLTFDDPVWVGGSTYYGRANADYSDEGFIYHKYFLKSDEEITALAHTGWVLQSSADEIPSADVSGTFANTIFASEDGASDYMLIQGKWYFNKNGSLYVSDDLQGSNLQKVEAISTSVYYSHMQDGIIYFTDFARIYAWNPKRANKIEVVASGSTISELSIKKEQIVYVSLEGTESERNTVGFETRLGLDVPTFGSPVFYASKVKLSWTGSSQVDGYVIEVKEEGEEKYKTLKRLDGTDKCTYSHVVKDAKKYQYRIRSFINVGSNKWYSDYSEVVSGFALPQKVENTKAERLADGRVEFSWTSVEGADGYVIYEQNESGKWKVVKKIVGDATEYKKRVDEGSHTYSIRAFREKDGKLYYGERSQVFEI